MNIVRAVMFTDNFLPAGDAESDAFACTTTGTRSGLGLLRRLKGAVPASGMAAR
jgi:hypothetical protein